MQNIVRIITMMGRESSGNLWIFRDNFQFKLIRSCLEQNGEGRRNLLSRGELYPRTNKIRHSHFGECSHDAARSPAQ